LPGPRHPSGAAPARIQAPPPNDSSRQTIVQMSLSCGRASAPGRWIIATNENIMNPTDRPDQRTAVLVAMLKEERDGGDAHGDHGHEYSSRPSGIISPEVSRARPRCR
jgi:hypothetical protein